jgi:hypothetical protein
MSSPRPGDPPSATAGCRGSRGRGRRQRPGHAVHARRPAWLGRWRRGSTGICGRPLEVAPDLVRKARLVVVSTVVRGDDVRAADPELAHQLLEVVSGLSYLANASGAMMTAGARDRGGRGFPSSAGPSTDFTRPALGPGTRRRPPRGRLTRRCHVPLAQMAVFVPWELPALGTVTAPSRVDSAGRVRCLGGTPTQLGLADALTVWFGPPTAAQCTGDPLDVTGTTSLTPTAGLAAAASARSQWRPAGSRRRVRRAPAGSPDRGRRSARSGPARRPS